LRMWFFTPAAAAKYYSRKENRTQNSRIFSKIASLHGMASLLPFKGVMKHQFTTRLLAHVTSEINSGHALWAMFWANSYLDERDPLRLGLLAKARKKLKASPSFDEDGQAIFQHLEQGLSLNELSADLRQRLRKEREESTGKRSADLRFLNGRRSHLRRSRAIGSRRTARRQPSELINKIRSGERVHAESTGKNTQAKVLRMY